MKGYVCLVVGLWLLVTAPLGAVELADARQLAVQGRFQEALSSVDRALAADPDSAEARFLRGFVLARAGRDEEALQVFLDLTRNHPEYPEPFNNVAVIYARRGDYERAVEILKQALRTHSSYRTAYENLTKVYGQLASRAYDRALGQESAAPSLGPALSLLGDLDVGTSGRRDDDSRVVVLEPLTAAPAVPSGSPEPESPPAADEIATAPAAAITREAAVATPLPSTPAPDAVFDASELVDVVRGWARAWSEQRVEDYLGYYSSRFSPGDGVSRSNWATQRRERIRRPRSIEVRVESIGVRPLAGGRAQVKFLQSYRSDSFEDSVTKTLDMTRENGVWKIEREESRPE